MTWTILIVDLVLACMGLITVSALRRKDTVSGWHLLIFPAYWGGTAALGHLIVMMGLGSMLGMLESTAGFLMSSLYYGACALWGGLMVAGWNRLNR